MPVVENTNKRDLFCKLRFISTMAIRVSGRQLVPTRCLECGVMPYRALLGLDSPC